MLQSVEDVKFSLHAAILPQYSVSHEISPLIIDDTLAPLGNALAPPWAVKIPVLPFTFVLLSSAWVSTFVPSLLPSQRVFTSSFIQLQFILLNGQVSIRNLGWTALFERPVTEAAFSTSQYGLLDHR